MHCRWMSVRSSGDEADVLRLEDVSARHLASGGRRGLKGEPTGPPFLHVMIYCPGDWPPLLDLCLEITSAPRPVVAYPELLPFHLPV